MAFSVDFVTGSAVWTPRRLLFPAAHDRRGVALITVLSFVAIISLMLVTFMTVMRMERSASRNYSQSVKAEQLGLGALDLVISRLQDEMTAGSTTAATTDGGTVMVPRTAATAFPARLGTISGLPNLIQRSLADAAAHAAAYPAARYTNPPALLASPSNSSTLTLNSRSISRTRWERANLGSFPVLGASSTPDWILVTRSGARPFTHADLPTLRNPQSADYALGRFAYAIYDLSGLLNLNAAGHPINSPPAGTTFDGATAAKNSIVWADLTQLGLTQAQIDALIAWRQRKNASSAAAFLDFTRNFGAPTGFSQVDGTTSLSDDIFLSRQELITYARANGFASALPWLTHFHRHLESPGYAWGGSIPDPALDPNPATIRVSGQPLRRFPLAKLSLLEIPNPEPGDRDDIARYFGLAPGPGFSSTHRVWVYNAGGGTSAPIKTLATVAAEGRQPNLFEILLAALPRQSLGRNAGNTVAHTDAPDSNIYHQVARIAAAIIDQADADGYPTILHFTDQSGTAFQFYGIEDLPYFSEIFVKFRHNTATDRVEHYVFLELWNPHRTPPAPPASRPTGFRLAVTPQSRWMIGDGGNHPKVGYQPFSFLGVSTIPTGDPELYREPRVINNPGDPNHFNLGTPGLQFNGWRLSDTVGLPPDRETWNFQNAIFLLQYQDGSSWRTYTTFAGLIQANGTPLNSTGLQPTGHWYHTSMINETWRPGFANQTLLTYPKLDPRTHRFGTSFSQPIWMNFTPLNASMAPGGVAARFGGDLQWVDQQKPGFLLPPWQGGDNPSASPWFENSSPGKLWENREAPNRYDDHDEVFRPGDGALTRTNADCAMHTGNTTHRPLILNRPFRSVGELGHVFRDLPWRTLDFFSADSADAGLLDWFTIHELKEDNQIRHDTFNPNTPHREVLAAMIVGAERDPYAGGPGNRISSANALSIADDIIAATQNQPWPTPSSIILNFPKYGGNAPTLTSNPGTLNASSLPAVQAATYPSAKNLREALPRALASASSTRTWNLMIDLVAQSGRYTPNSSSLDQFRVEGERRYWLHLAIDRLTGQVIARQLEPVYE